MRWKMPGYVREMLGPAESLTGVFGDMADTSSRVGLVHLGTLRGPDGARPSLDTAPPHEARCRPVGLRRLDQPAAGMLSSDCDALRLPGLDRHPVHPDRRPARIEPIQQSEG